MKSVKLLQEERSDEGSYSQSNSKHNSYSNDEQSQFSASNDSWINVTSNLNNLSRIICSNLIHLIPQTANKFEVLTNLNKEIESSRVSVAKDTTSCSRNLRKKYPPTKKTLNSSTRNGKKIIMIGDSHVRNCATELQYTLGANCKVPSFVNTRCQNGCNCKHCKRCN
jgi:hypothetical protein